MNQPMVVQRPGGMSAHSTRDINKVLVSPHFLLEIPMDGVFTPYGRLSISRTANSDII